MHAGLYACKYSGIHNMLVYSDTHLNSCALRPAIAARAVKQAQLKAALACNK